MTIKALEPSTTWVSRWEVESNTSDRVYTVAQKADGTFGCDCPAWKFKKAPRPDCKHILRVKMVEHAMSTTCPIEKIIKQSDEMIVGATFTPVKTPKATAPVFLLQTQRRIQLED